MNAMELSELGIDTLVEQAAQLLSALGLPHHSELQPIREFLGGPAVVMVTGPSRSGKSSIVAALADVNAAVLETPLRQFNPLDAYDVAIFTTPAEAALSADECLRIRELSSLRRPCLLVVTGAEGLGAGDQRKAGEEEIRRLRLEPALGPVRVPFWFLGHDDDSRPVAEAIREKLAAIRPRLHERPVLDALGDILRRSTVAFEDSVRKRDGDLKVFGNLESEIPLVLAHLHEVGRMAVLDIRERVREAEDQLQESTRDCADAINAWWIQGMRGDAEDVLDIGREGWKAFIAAVAQAVPATKARFLSEVSRVVRRPATVSHELAFEASVPEIPEAVWLSDETTRVLERLSAVVIEPVLIAALQVASKENPSRMDLPAPRSLSPGDKVGSKDLAKIKDLADRLTALAAQASGGSLLERLRSLLSTGFDAMVKPRLEAFTDAATVDIGRATVVCAAEAEALLAKQVGELRAQLASRYSWAQPLATMMRLGDAVDSRLSEA